MYGSLDEYYESLRPDGEIRSVIDRLGGPRALVRKLDGGGEAWRVDEIRAAAIEIIKDKTKLPGGGKTALPGERK